MKLELKHLAPYLPYGLKCQYFGIVDVLKYIDAKFDDPFNIEDSGKGLKIEDSGKGLKIGELKEIKVYRKYWTALIGKHHNHLKVSANGYDIKPILRPLSDLTKEIKIGGKRFVPMVNMVSVFGKSLSNLNEKGLAEAGIRLVADIKSKTLPYRFMELLIEWHFDLFGLIEAGLAIDINTLNN